MDYGLTNTRGVVSPAEVTQILAYAEEHSIGLLDTAPAYGDSEDVIGRALPATSRMRIVTKTPAFRSQLVSGTEVEQLKVCLRRSLGRLQRESVYGLLLHDSDDLVAPGGALLLKAMREEVASGRVRKIGISVYNGEQIDRALQLFTPDIVQCPLNVFDQRLVKSGHLAKLKDLGVEIHVRSVFLQGVLLGAQGRLPHPLAEHSEHVQRYFWCLSGSRVGKLEAALGFIASQPNVDCGLVGVTGLAELKDALGVLQRQPGPALPYADFALHDAHAIDPSKWKTTA